MAGKCLDCSAETTGMSLRCDKCKRAHNAETSKQYYQRHHERKQDPNYERAIHAQQDQWLGRTVVVIADPRPYDDGGFRPGALLTNTELRYMLKQGDGTLLDGTRLRDKKKKKDYIVERGKMCPAGR